MMIGVLVMNKKGFTLTELLAIIVLIALIIGIAAPSITEQVKTEEEERQNILNKKIENASKLYAAKYYADKLVELPSCTGSDCDISFDFSDLEKDGLIDFDDECNQDNETIKVTYDNNKIKYNIPRGECYITKED